MFNFFMFLVLLYIKIFFYKMNIEKPIFWTDLKIDFERVLYFQ